MVLEIALDLDQQGSAGQQGLDCVTIEILDANFLEPTGLHDAGDPHLFPAWAARSGPTLAAKVLVDDATPVDVMKMAILAATDETDRRCLQNGWCS
jgi:hypothetical protein